MIAWKGYIRSQVIRTLLSLVHVVVTGVLTKIIKSSVCIRNTVLHGHRLQNIYKVNQQNRLEIAFKKFFNQNVNNLTSLLLVRTKNCYNYMKLILMNGDACQNSLKPKIHKLLRNVITSWNKWMTRLQQIILKKCWSRALQCQKNHHMEIGPQRN